MTTTRRRPRVVTPAEVNTTEKVTKSMRDLAGTVFTKNKEMNAAKTAHDKARKELYGAMKDADVSTFTSSTMFKGQRVPLEIEVKAPVRSVVDLDKLRKLVSADVFNKIISASVAAVEEHAGKAVANQCTVSVEGTENVNVKQPKA